MCFAAFVVTFVATRTITRLIRAGRGPFKDNVSSGGVHVHHAVPGVILVIAGGFTALVVDLDSPWSIAAGLFIGIGASLVLDEFALILRLDDVYWAEEGRLSVEVVSLAIACLGLLLLGANPFAFAESDDATAAVVGTVIAIVVHLAGIVFCLAKGKYTMALLGTFIPFVALVGALRLARPSSWWARRWYSPPKQQRAAVRARRHDTRWGPVTESITDVVAGKPTPVAPPTELET